jgi:hypothetical protein
MGAWPGDVKHGVVRIAPQTESTRSVPVPAYFQALTPYTLFTPPPRPRSAQDHSPRSGSA